MNIDNTGKEEQEEEAGIANSKQVKERTAKLVGQARQLFREMEREAIHVKSEPRSSGWGATHLRAAASTKLPTQRGSKWVCVGIERRKQKAERHEKEWEEGKGEVTSTVTLWLGTWSGINAENIQIIKKSKRIRHQCCSAPNLVG